MEEKREVNILGFFRLIKFLIMDYFFYLDFLFSPAEKVKESVSIPEGLPEVRCLQDYYKEGKIEIWTAKLGDLLFRWPIITFLLWHFKLKYISSLGFLPLAISSPRIIVIFFMWLCQLIFKLFIHFVTPLTRVPVPRNPSGSLFISKVVIPKPHLFDVFKEFFKLFLRKLFWFFVSLFLLGVVLSLLFGEGYFWYSTFTGGLNPFKMPTDPTREYFTIQTLPLIGVLPFTLYLDKVGWTLLLVPVATLLLFLLSIWDKLERGKLDELPIFEFFNVIFSPQSVKINKRMMAYFALLTIVIEVYCVYKIFFDYLTKYFLSNSSIITQFLICFGLSLFVPVIFTTIEVYAFTGMIKLWKTQILH